MGAFPSVRVAHRGDIVDEVVTSALEISAAEDLRGSGLLPTQTESMRSPATRLLSPLAMVSTSGNSGMMNKSSHGPGHIPEGEEGSTP